MGYSRPTFEVQGITFKLKPTSPRNVQNLMEYVEDSDIQPDEDQPFHGLAEQYMDVLRRMAEPQGDGSFEDIDPLDLDINKVDYYLEDFLPVGTAT